MPDKICRKHSDRRVVLHAILPHDTYYILLYYFFYENAIEKRKSDPKVGF